MNKIDPRDNQKIQCLRDLQGCIGSLLFQLKNGNVDKSERMLEKIIDIMENPVVIKNLKDVKNGLGIPF